MKKIKILNALLMLFFLLSAPIVSANCMWATNNQCSDIGTTNSWTAASSDTNCGTPKNDPSAKCCCAADVNGCCKKTDSNGVVTTDNLTGQQCQAITYATTNFYQDQQAVNNNCISKKLSANGCGWKIYYSSTSQSQQASGGCSSDENQAANAQCTGPKDSLMWPASDMCCCPKSTGIQLSPPVRPLFILPDIQIPIPGLNLTPSSSIQWDTSTGAVQIPWISEYILGLYNYGISIAGILAAIVLMAGGALWLVSGGDASRVTQAKELITGSVTGLIILMSSYVLLYTINPELTVFPPITIGTITHVDLEVAATKNNSTAMQYKTAACASDAELASGVNFYATGYYKPAWEDSDNFRCIVAMQCSCPNGQDTSKNCDQLYGKTYPGYHPCNSFPSTTTYCNKTKNGSTPQAGDIAGPSNCSNLPLNSQVCFKGKTYTITDGGGGIQGRRIDIWSGTSLNQALNSTGVGVLKKGACN